LSQFFTFSSSPDWHFLGVAGDCGIALGNHSSSPSAMISVIRAKEVVQAKIAEAMEHAAIKEAQDKRERDQEAAKVETTSAVVAPTLNSQAECREGEMEDPEAIIVASLSKEKKKAPKVMLPPRTNLRSTPARQARALNLVQQ
jgi:hypothetical protein